MNTNDYHVDKHKKSGASIFDQLGGAPEGQEEKISKLEAELTEARIAAAAKAQAEQEEAVKESTFQATQVIELAKADMDFLAGLAMPTVFKYLFPPVFRAVWEWLLEYVAKPRDFSQLALGLPRGFGKTVLVKLFILYCILFTNKKFILILAENQTKANNILADVIDMLQEENIKRVFGDWKIGIETDRQDLKKFGFRGRNIILMAGTVEVIRGISLKNERPDVMIFDDIQSRVMAESQVISEALEREMVGTAMKAKSPHGCLFIFVGNMYPTKWSLLRRLKTNPNWVKFIAGGILADGTSLWEELQPLQQLLREYENDLLAGRPEIFYSEVLNDENAAAHNLVDFTKIPDANYAGEISAGSYIVVDPSGYKKKSDETAIGYFEIHDTVPVLMELKSARMSPGDAIRTCLTLALKYNCRAVFIESVAYQATFAYWFNFICTQLGIIGIEPVEIYPGGISKNSRILGMFKQYQSGEIRIHPSCRAEVHTQISSFNPLKTDNTDDILDLLTYAHMVLQEYGAWIVSMSTIEMQAFDNVKVDEFNSPF